MKWVSKTAYNKLALGGYTYIARNEVTRKSLLSNWDLTNSFQKRVQRIYLDEQEILFSESFSSFQAIVDWLALKTTVLKLLTLRSLFRRLPMAADGTESKLCTGRRNVFNRLVINSLL